MDHNRYATKKTIAQGMLDVALLTANASQLKYVLQLGEDKHPFYTLMLSLIIISIIFQVSSCNVHFEQASFFAPDIQKSYDMVSLPTYSLNHFQGL